MVTTRRTTLGGISANRRMSVAGGMESSSNNLSKPSSSTTRTRKQRMSMAPRMTGGMGIEGSGSGSGSGSGNSKPSNRRSSLAAPSNRRKSVAGEHLHAHSHSHSHRLSSIPASTTTTLKTDPRPISEKPYVNTCIRRLHQYLEQNDYEHPIKLKDLSRPSAKDFHNFMTFLLRKIDPLFNTSVKRKFEDEVVVAFKIIGYPFNISKTALVAAGSSHTWPTLLLSITWLIEVLEGGSGSGFESGSVDDNMDYTIEGGNVGEAGMPFENVEKLEKRTELAYLKYTEISYGAFLSGDDEHFEKMEVDFLEYHEKDNMVIEQVIEGIMDENVVAQTEFEDFRQEGVDLPERERHLEDLANDIEKFHALVQQLREHKAALEKKVHDSSKQLQEQEDTLEKKEAKLDHLRQVIENQEFSMDDIHKLESEVANIQEKIRQTKIAKEKNEDVTLNKALELNKLFDDLHVIAEDFNLKLVRLFQNGNGNGNGNVSDNDKISAHIISIQKTCAHDEDQKALLGGLDLMESMNVWRKEKIKLSEKNSQLRRDVFELTDKKEESEEVVKETNGNIEVLVNKKRLSEETLNKEQKQNARMSADKTEGLEHLEKSVRSLRDPGTYEESISKFQQELEELQSARENEIAGCKKMKEDVLREFNHFVEAFSSLMTYQDKVLKDLHDYKDYQEEYKVELSKEDKEIVSSGRRK